MKILILVVVVILNIPTSESFFFFFANFLITLSLPICGKVDIPESMCTKLVQCTCCISFLYRFIWNYICRWFGYTTPAGSPTAAAWRLIARSAVCSTLYSNMKLPIFILKLLINSPYSTHLGQVKYEEHFDYSRSRVVSSSWSDNWHTLQFWLITD